MAIYGIPEVPGSTSPLPKQPLYGIPTGEPGSPFPGNVIGTKPLPIKQPLYGIPAGEPGSPFPGNVIGPKPVGVVKQPIYGINPPIGNIIGPRLLPELYPSTGSALDSSFVQQLLPPLLSNLGGFAPPSRLTYPLKNTLRRGAPVQQVDHNPLVAALLAAIRARALG